MRSDFEYVFFLAIFPPKPGKGGRVLLKFWALISTIFALPPKCLVTHPEGGRNKPLIQFAEFVSRPTWIHVWLVDVKELNDMQTKICISPDSPVKKKVRSCMSDVQWSIFLSGIAVLWFWVYFMWGFSSVYAYTRAAHMTRGAWYNLMLTQPYLCTSPFFYVTLLYQLESVRNYQVHLIKVLDNAQRELLIPVTYPQEIDLATDEDEELRDIRANVFPPSDWSATVLHTDHMLGRCPYVNQHWHQARQLSLDVAAYMSSYSTEDERLQSLAPETGSRFLMSVFLLFKTTRVKC